MKNVLPSSKARQASRRSPSAARAHTTGEVTWVLDLATGTRARTKASSAPRMMSGLVLVAIGLWVYDMGLLIVGLHR
jgi:hypothetical protein